MGESTGWIGWVIRPQYQMKAKFDGTWQHGLFAELGEPEPDKNHVHIKFRPDGDFVLASVRVDGVRIINRGDLLNKINPLIGTKFTVKDEQGE